MSRTILYYPEIQIPTSGTWIRKSLLYWDRLGAIVPRTYDDRMDAQLLKRYTPEIEYLYKEGVFIPFNPESLMWESGTLKALRTEVKRVLIPSKPKSKAPEIVHKCDVAIYRDKVAYEVFRALKTGGLAIESPDDDDFYLFERRTANIYMALLAKHLASNASEPTIPSSDSEAELDVMFGSDKERKSENLIISPQFSDLIPTPNPDIPLRKIMKFKAKHQAELLAFYAAMDGFEQGVAECESAKQLTSLIQSQKDQIKKQIIDLSKALKANSIGSWLGSLQSFIKPNSPTLLGAAVVVAGEATSIATVPVDWVAGGAALAGSIEVGMHWFNKVQERNAAIRNSSFAYLYLANKKLG